MPVLLPAHRAALALREPLKQAGFMVHVHWVAIKLDDILVVREILKTYGTHDRASLPFSLCELGLQVPVPVLAVIYPRFQPSKYVILIVRVIGFSQLSTIAILGVAPSLATKDEDVRGKGQQDHQDQK